MPFPPQVCGRFQAATRSDITSESHSSIRATAAEGEGGTKADLSMEEVSYSTLGIRDETTPTLNTSPPPVTDVATGGPSTRSPGTEHIEHRPTEAIAVEHAAVDRTPSSDVEALSSISRTPVLDDSVPIGMPLPFDLSISPSERASFTRI